MNSDLDSDTTDGAKPDKHKTRRGSESASRPADLPPVELALPDAADDTDPATSTTEDDDEARLPELAEEL